VRLTVGYSDVHSNFDADKYADRHTECFTDLYTWWRRSTGTVGNGNNRTGT
jgi:hypothetical protein